MSRVFGFSIQQLKHVVEEVVPVSTTSYGNKFYLFAINAMICTVMSNHGPVSISRDAASEYFLLMTALSFLASIGAEDS